MDKKIDTAVIAVAGWGTRWLPLTKSVEKCMLPVGTRPIVDWIVRDCVKAGIRRIIFVVGESSAQIRSYYTPNQPLEDYLIANHKDAALDLVQQSQYKDVSFEFIVQPAEGIYGTAVPVALAYENIGDDENVAVFMGDDFVYRDDGRNEIADFIAEWQKCDAQSAMMVSEVAVEDAPRYGIVMTNEEGNYKEVLEKPSIEIAKTLIEPQITISKYIFGAGMKRYVHEFVARNKPAGEEYYIFDPMDAAVAEGHKFHTYHIKGEYLDGGNPQSWLYANQVVTH